MDFSFSETEQAFAAEVRAWLDKHLPREWRRDHLWTKADDPTWSSIAREWQKKLYDGGWAAISFPREHGGRAATVIERWLFDEELDRAGAPRPATGAYVDLIGGAILRHGSEEQRRRYLVPLLNGEELWCQGFSEPGAGSDLAGLKTRGVRDGDDYVVSGQKVWTSYADIADRCFLLCRTELDQPKHKGISLLLVDMKSPGISVRPLQQATGDAEFCEVFFEDVRVPVANRVGAPGAGWSIAMGILAHERGPVWTFGFQRRIRRDLERLIAAAREHGADDLLRQRIAQSWIEVEILRFVGYRSLTRLLKRGEPGLESSIEKVLGSETDQRLQDVMLAALGPRAVAPKESGEHGKALERSFLYARSETIMGGTSEIQRNIIAQRLLGLPR